MGHKSFSRMLAAAFIYATLFLTGCGGGGGGAVSVPTDAGSILTLATNLSSTVPSAPTIWMTTHGNASATVNFTTPFDGGSAITGYIVTSNPGNITATGTGTATNITVNGLTNGTSYTFKVAAVNANGTGPASSQSTTVTPSTTPGAPAIGTATPGNASATVSFTPPTDNGGAPVTGYTVTSNPGNLTATGTASPIAITGLTNGTSYTFTVTARNVNGSGAASTPSAAVTPSTVPGAPTSVRAAAGNASATVSFVPPTNNGGAVITGYTVTSNPGNLTATGAASPITVSGLTNNTAYTFTVTAANLDGSSVASGPSNSVIAIANPGPYYVDPIAGLNTNPGTAGSPFKTITYALAVASGVGTANTINAVAGTYSDATGETFPLRMVDKVNLTGAGSATTTINGLGGNYNLNFRTLTSVLAIPPNVTSSVSGFTITGGSYSVATTTVLVVVDNATSGTLANNVITSAAPATADAVWVLFGGSATLTGNTIAGTGHWGGYGGLAIWAGNPTVTARNNTISDTANPAVNIWGLSGVSSPFVDLGTSGSPGGNTITGPAGSVGINIKGTTNWVNASGNIWHKNTQGSSAGSTYGVGTIGLNPTTLTAGNNYAIVPDSALGTPSAGLQF